MSSLGDVRPVVITGATGQLGTAFSSLIASPTLLTRSDLDLSEPGAVEHVIERLAPSAVVNCAAYTNVDSAEEEEELATVVNGHAVGELAKVTSRLGIPLVTFSTDYVFDGSAASPYVESDVVAPINAYGRSKLLGEELCNRYNPDALIIRTSWVVSETHDNFVSTMLRMTSEEGSAVRVVNDQRGCPTVVDDLASASLVAMRLGVGGVLHLSNGPATTWFDLASYAIGYAGLPGTVTPCSTDEFPRPAPRPRNSVLDSERLSTLPGIVLPPWQESMPGVIDAQLRRLAAKD